MSNIRGDDEVDSGSYLKLAHLCTAITQHFHIEEVDGILQNAGNINYKFPPDLCLKSSKSELIGSTVLHFAVIYDCWNHLDMVKLLLDYGADYTLKNDKGLTALHQAVESIFEKSRDSWKLLSTLENEYISEILSRQVQLRNPTNPCSSNGMSHFHVACMTNHQKAVLFFLENGTSVDQAVSMSASYFPGYTPLHFAVRFWAVETIEILLKFHAKVNVPDALGMTPMHVAIERKMEIRDLIILGEKKLHQMGILDWSNPSDYEDEDDKNLPEYKQAYEKIVKILMQSYLSDKNTFTDSIGLTFFHIACAMNDKSITKRCIKQIQDINRCVNFDSPLWPGYTALHFAALFNIKTIKLLLKNGASMKIKDANGVSPFDICLETYTLDDIYSIISNHPIWKSIMFSDGKTSLLDVIADMKKSNSTVELENMNIFIPFNSPLWPGYTPLHIAVVFAVRAKDACTYNRCAYGCNKLDEKYLAGGVNLSAKDANGSTPLHLAFQLQKTGVIERFVKWNIPYSVNNDNLSHLHIAAAMDDFDLITQLLKSGANVNSPVQTSFEYFESPFHTEDPASFIIPKGSTALHIAAVRNNQKSMRALLEHGANVYARDANGMTPIHRQIVKEKHWYTEYTEQTMLNILRLKNCINDSCNLSHLHVACFLGEEKVVERLLNRGADLNAAVKCVDPSNESLQFLAPYAGFTPLHFALKRHSHDVCKLLIKRGADIYAQGPIPLFQELISNWNYDFFQMFEENEDLRSRMFEQTGLTMLHLACYDLDQHWDRYGRWNEVDHNARSHEDSPVWPRCTPFDVLIRRLDKYDEDPEDIWTIDTLIEDGFLVAGADVTLLNGYNSTPVLDIDRMNREYKEKIVYDYENYEERRGRPFDNPHWHNMNYDTDSSEEMPSKKVKVKCVWNNSTREENEIIRYSRRLCALLRAQKDFSVNPTNDKGISHFHVACLYKFYDVVEKFLKHNVDVNAAVSLFSDEFPGCTPLHLTIRGLADPKLTQLLLDYGANVHARDVYGNTTLHFAAKNSKKNLDLFQMIMNKGANITIRNLFGETPLDVLLSSYQNSDIALVEMIQFSMQQGHRVNSFNPVSQKGWIPEVLSKCYKSSYREQKIIYDTILNAPDLIEIDNIGRTAIHNLSSCSHLVTGGIELLKALAKQGYCYNVDHQDVIGRSALHIAVQFKNIKAVTELLKLGADLNLKDANGKVPFAYCFEASPLIALRRVFNHSHSIGSGKDNEMVQLFVEQIRKLQLLELDVCKNNLMVLKNTDRKITVDCSRLREHFERSKHIKIEYEKFSFQLCDLLSETKIVAAYPRMLPAKRRALNKFFRSDDIDNKCKNVDELLGFLKLQYKKAVERGSLMKDANNCLNILARFTVPDLISEMIIKQLSNMDLQNLLASVSDELLSARRRF